jgi:N-acetylmuramoyl-L-alanine amidase
MLPYLPRMRTLHQEFLEERLARKEQKINNIEMTDLEISGEDDGAGEKLGDLCLTLPDNVDASQITVTDDYISRTLSIEIPGIDEGYFDKSPISGSSNHVDGISYRMSGSVGIIEIAMDTVYEVSEQYEGNKYYFTFQKPKDLYDKVVVIDAGHGGRTPGASKQGIKEKNINLAILTCLKQIFDESDQNIGVYYTRTDDSNPTFAQRVQLANGSDADLFVSIHNNSMGSGRMSSTSGTQVMYDEESESSKAFAEICLDEVTDSLGSRKAGTGLVKGDSIYIIRNSEVPVALIEVGFLTNQEELDALNSEEYQMKAAEGIYNAIMKAFEEGF